MLVAIDALTKKVAAEPLKDRLASTTAAGMKKVFQALGVPANVYSDDGAEFKREFKELMDFWDIEKQVTRGHAYFAERTIRTIKEAMLRRVAAGAGRRGQWHLMLADILSQINGRKHATTQVAPNLAYSDPEMAEIALRNIERRAKHKVTRPEIKVGDMVRIRVKPIESRGSYRVNEIAWSEKVYRVVSAESGEMGRGLAWRGGRKRWCTGIFEKSPKTQLPNRGGWRCNPASGGYREAPGSHLLFDCASTCASTSLRSLRHLPLTDELLIVGSGRAAWRSPDVPKYPLHVPRSISLKPAQGKLCPLGARGLAVNSLFRDVVHLVLDLTQVPKPFLEAFDFRLLHLEVFDETPLVRALGVEDLDAAALVRALGLKQRILARPLVGRPLGHLSSRKAGIVRPRSGLLQEPCLHAPEGRRGSHLFEQQCFAAAGD